MRAGPLDHFAGLGFHGISHAQPFGKLLAQGHLDPVGRLLSPFLKCFHLKDIEPGLLSDTPPKG